MSASRVGATAAAFCLRRLGIEAIVLPTTLMGRHPGWGNPGGGASDVNQLRKMWEAIESQEIKFDAVLTGYMGDISHIDLSKKIINSVKHSNPNALILVDPVMGDNGSLYIPEERANSIASQLLPFADIATPNLWELSFLSQSTPKTLSDTIESSKPLAPITLVTSVMDNDKIGTVLTTAAKDSAPLQLSHEKFETVPHGGGDALAATFLAHLLKGKSAQGAMEYAVGSIFQIMTSANASDAGELPLVREQSALTEASPLKAKII